MTRKESRTNAFMLLFSLYANNDLDIDSIDLEDEGVLEKDEFCNDLIEKTTAHLTEIDAAISEHLQGWTLERLPKTSLAILRLSAAQLLYMPDIPTGVVISEAVELAKHFGSSNDYVFINGALGSFEKSLNRPERESNAKQ